MKHRVISKTLVIYLSLMFLMFLVPLLLRDPYYLHIAIMSLIAGTGGLGLRLILCTGHLSLGQAVFLGAGAYTSVLLVCRLGLSFWLALPISGVLASVFAALTGWPALRLKGAYFALLTIGLGEAARLALINGGKLTGGPAGIPGGPTVIKAIPPPNPIVIWELLVVEFGSKTSYYYLILVLFIITAVVTYVIDRSRTGTILAAIQQSDTLAESVGINVTRYNILAFSTASFFTGLTGAFYAHYIRCITPEDLNFWRSVDVVVYTIIGGRANIFGPIIGAMSMVGLSSSIAFLAQYQTIFYGGVSILVLLLLPEGLISLPSLILHSLRQCRGYLRDSKHD